MRYKTLNIFLIIIILSSSSSYMALAQSGSSINGQTLRWGYIELPPLSSSTPLGQPAGDLIEIGEAVLKKAGYNWKYVLYPSARMLDKLEKGYLDLWIGVPPPSVHKKFLLVGKFNILQSYLCAYRIGRKPPILAKEDLRGKSVLMLRGYTYGGWMDFIKNPVNLVHYYEINDSHKGAFKMLMAGRADYLLNYSGPSEQVLEKMSIPNLKYNIIEAFGVKFVISRKTPNAEKLLNQLEFTYQTLLEQGKF